MSPSMPIGPAGDAGRFAPYEILAPLGRGGMGEVYRAWDPRLQREVALKMLRQHRGGDPSRLVRFAAEARAASALNHPNILSVYDAVVDGTTPYIVTELIDGQSLRDALRGGAMPLKRLLDLAAQIADGLAEAHAAGIVHRDLKPENIMITRGGRAKILDFGLAMPTGAGNVSPAPSPPAAGDTITEPGLIAGTRPYMSPEQARGVATDFRSDQFSFGLILHEMATGQPVFMRASPAETLDAVINEEPAPLASRVFSVPVALSWIVERCLAKEPDGRYASTADLYRDLRTLRDRLPDVQRREPAAPGPTRLRQALLAAAAIGVIALAATMTAAWRLSRQTPPVDLSDLRFRAIATGAAYEGLPALSPDGQIVAYVADVDGVLQIFTRRLAADTAAQVTSCAYDCKHPFWSPDGKRLYYVSLARQRDGIWSIGVAGGTPQVVVENATRAAMSPDGRTIAFLRDDERADTIGTAALWLSTPGGPAPWPSESVERAARRFEPLGTTRFIEAALAFSPDGRSVGLCGVPSTREERMWQFWMVPLTGGEPRRRLQWWSDAGPRNVSFSWFPDSRHIALGVTSLSTPGSHLWIADLATDRAWPVTRGADSESFPSVAAAGDRIVFTRGEPDYDLLQIPLTRGGAAQTLFATPQNESDPAFSPDGRVMAYVTDRNGQDEIWRRTVDGSIDQPLITQREFGSDRTVMLSSPAFSPDGRRIAYQRNGFAPRWPLRIWISLVEGGAPAPLLLAEHDGIHSGPTWSPDGQWIAFAQWTGGQWQLAKVRVGSGEGPVVLRRDGVANAAPHWSPGTPEWITWETASGLLLVSPDGTNQRELSKDQWLVHAWSSDGSQLLAIKQTDDLRLILIAFSIASGTETVIADLGASFAFNNPVKGLTVMTGGRSIATALVRPRGDLWIAEGIKWR